MSDRPTDPTENAASRDETGMPRWVKISLIVTAAVVAAVIVVSLIAGHQLGPGRHFGLGASATSEAVGHSIPSYSPGGTDGGATYR